ncbi:MAG: beta-ketoacyl-ACP synthase III [Proteobacteria bacterium]|nr:beta-ketoacyl-ACP synthase III [Pseudomonadota bacterium]MBU4296431.1 beta-ketoacyl-ACP synthase III [Pseudomonadota bacterium]MCG2748700.1 beta-ketoacyl-ACP synthase III [Desulfobulbaceae bacterium]
MRAFITAVSAFLPGKPVENEELETYLGKVNKISARTRQIILANNGIKTRHYAVDPQTGATTHTNAQLTAEAVRLLIGGAHHPGAAIECLCCGTSSPDQLMPGHGVMVHGELGFGPCEVVTTAGICLSGITAMKYAAMSVAAGLAGRAVATGSELASSFMKTSFFQTMQQGADQAENSSRQPAFSFEAEFLRWMLSDGAGAVLLEREPPADRPSLRIDWIELMSHAHRLEACMYAGAVKQKDGSLKGWRECAMEGIAPANGVFTVKQDARLLNREVIRTLVGQSLPMVAAKHGLTAGDVDWFLPHYSSGYFREPLLLQLREIGFSIPEERWFTNLATRGNTGSASFYIMLEELFSSGRLQKGERILGVIPESGRFSVGWVLLTVV